MSDDKYYSEGASHTSDLDMNVSNFMYIKLCGVVTHPYHGMDIPSHSFLWDAVTNPWLNSNVNF